jgi:hypothetical protein
MFRTNYITSHDASKWAARRAWARAEGNPDWRGVGRILPKNVAAQAHSAPVLPRRKGWLPDFVKRRFQAGEEFNRVNRARYPYNEVEVLGPDGNTFKVDSYDPVGREIVFRRLTQFADIQEETALQYFGKFLRRKYPRGAIITDSPFSPRILWGQRLKGDLVFEIPIQEKPIPQTVLEAAADRGIILRDPAGSVYP